MMKTAVRLDGFIGVYHSTSSHVPDKIAERIHNVTPEAVYQQASWIKRYYDVVTVDEWVCADDKTGKAAITFDDGYRSVLDEVVPLLLELKLPLTVFVCGHMLDGGIFWRDKIRFLSRSGLVEEFLRFLDGSVHIEGMYRNQDFFRQAATLLNDLGVRRSNVFCVPFGMSRATNEDTFEICTELGLSGILFCGDKPPASLESPGNNLLPFYDRTLFPSSLNRLREKFGTGLPVVYRLLQRIRHSFRTA